MSLTRWQRTIVNEAGDVIDGAEVEVFEAGATEKPDLFKDSGGNDVQTNPFNADSNGFAAFYVDGGLYDIAVNDVTLWTDVALGDVRGRNVGAGPDDVPDNSVLALRERIERDATLLLDFENNRYRIYEGLADGNTEKPYSQIITHTRASDATGFNALGTLSTVTSDTQRLVYSPETGRSKGLLVEEERTNVLLDNRDLSTGNWSTAGSPSLAQDRVGIDGAANTAWSITQTDDLGDRVEQGITIIDDSNTHLCAPYLKKSTSPLTRIQVRFEGGSELVNEYIDFDTFTGSVEGQTSNINFYIEDAGDWWRPVVSAANNGTGNTSMEIWIQADRTGSGATLGYDYGQVELNTSTASSPIETGGTAVTRAADVVSAENLDGVLTESRYGVLIEFDAPEEITGSFNFLCDLVNSSGSNPTAQLLRAYMNTPTNLVVSVADSGEIFSQGIPVTAGANKLYFGFNGSSYNWAMNGSNYGEMSGFPVSATTGKRWAIGQRSNQASQLNSTFSEGVLLPYALTESEAIALTQPEE